ncbi:hypothetical protein RFI_20587 [Reticulomyxa filosa]|uniref:Uncharacterized protein n=1 Tax=Reticulomyxa filosa TaxID=46433 RepID=X6MSV3_RETFI|nr:hypothetical protein RFI_20587 [Reticulomyxa filosa]|eukprot:ETO16751.1 hypothetical protein RFI_20587 [Reticulomyxa filosa]
MYILLETFELLSCYVQVTIFSYNVIERYLNVYDQYTLYRAIGKWLRCQQSKELSEVRTSQSWWHIRSQGGVIFGTCRNFFCVNGFCAAQKNLLNCGFLCFFLIIIQQAIFQLPDIPLIPKLNHENEEANNDGNDTEMIFLSLKKLDNAGYLHLRKEWRMLLLKQKTKLQLNEKKKRKYKYIKEKKVIVGFIYSSDGISCFF